MPHDEALPRVRGLDDDDAGECPPSLATLIDRLLGELAADPLHGRQRRERGRPRTRDKTATEVARRYYEVWLQQQTLSRRQALKIAFGKATTYHLDQLAYFEQCVLPRQRPPWLDMYEQHEKIGV